MARSKLAKAPSAAKKAVAKTGGRSSRAAKTLPAKATSRKTGSKNVGDVLGVSRARVPKGTPRATRDRSGNPKGVEIGPQAKGPAHLKPARARY